MICLAYKDAFRILYQNPSKIVQIDHLFRLNAAGDGAIYELYSVLHTFCLSIQLDVLYCQSISLRHDRLDGHMAIDSYKAGKELTLSYWKQMNRSSQTPKARFQQKSATSPVHYRLSIECEDEGLKIRHLPVSEEPLPDSLGGRDAQLSIENLITETGSVRSRQRLRQLKVKLEKATNLKCEQTGMTVAELTSRILTPSEREEDLCVTVNVFTGRYVPRIQGLGSSKKLKELRMALNSNNLSPVNGILDGLRYCSQLGNCFNSVRASQVCLSS